MTALWLTVSCVLMGVVFANLHAPWAPIPWLVCMALCLAFFRRVERAPEPHERNRPSTARTTGWSIALVLALAAFLRLYRIHELPLGPYVDEIQALRNALALSSAPFDYFASSPLSRPGWVQTSHVYLYFDWLILQGFGVSYLSMKLFSVLPGILTCVFFLLLCRTLFTPGIALAAGLFFTVGHWPVRLSRYGWDTAFSVMMFTAALWLLLLARERKRAVWACASGLVMGLGLYSYLGARVSALSLASVVGIDWLMKRDLASRDRLVAFGAGMTTAALPLLFGYSEEPGAAWVRAAELSIFSQPHPLRLFLENLLGHAGMFHGSGGAYARDNFPGVPMLDGVTGLLMLAGLWVLVRHRWRDVGWIAVLLLGLNALAGLLSTSQEGPPYVYRTAALMLPAFLMAGFGAEAIERSRWLDSLERFGGRRIVLLAMLAAALVWNFQLYFGLEARSGLAARVMAYELRLVADEVRDTELPVYIVGADTLSKRQYLGGAYPSRYLIRNPTFRFGTSYSLRSVKLLAGRSQQPGATGQAQKSVEIVDPRSFAQAPIATSAVLLFRPGGEGEASIRQRFPQLTVRYVEDVRGPPALGVATLGAGVGPPTHSGRSETVRPEVE